ncbi:MAG TPA: UPF0149 family protein [Methylococcus sp.]|nr:UPF0149 family protein [Methylococcus sp.]
MPHRASYQDIEEIVRNHYATATAAEAHGMLAGLLCVDSRLDCEQWLAMVFGDDAAELTVAERSSFAALCDVTRDQLDAFDFSFQLFLPDDESPLVDRARALGEWCQGFLYGVGFRLGSGEWPGECSEVLDDFVQLSRLDAEHVEEEADEGAYAELTEFVRAGVQLIRSEFEQKSSPRLH